MIIKSVLLEITDQCNLNCKHCMNRPNSLGIEMELPKIKEIFDKISSYQPEKVYLCGGEPLIHSSITDILKLCNNFPNTTFIIATNGLLLNSKLMLLIENIQNIRIQFSIDGVRKETYDFMRGKNMFELFQKKITLWDSISHKNGMARMCITKHNYKELPEVYKYAIEHKLTPSFIFVGKLGNGKNNWDDLEPNLAQKIWCIDTINTLNLNYNMKIIPPEAPSTCNFTENIFGNSLFIKTDGTVVPCQYFYNDSLGNIFIDNIEEMMHGEWVKAHCEIAQKRKQILQQSHKCNACKLKNACNYGCMGMANNLGNIYGYDDLCDFRVLTSVCYSNGIISKGNKDKPTSIRINKED